MEPVMLREPTQAGSGSHSPTGSISPADVSGILVVDKPPECTSFSVANEIKRLLGLRKVGHCGTLDPFATGVFVLCLNRATRIADQFLEQDKGYRCEIRFGFESDTQDRTGEILPVYNGPPISEDRLRQSLSRFLGTYDQQVPRYSAVKVRGRRLYALSRKGISLDLPRRCVHIHSITLSAFRWPNAVVEVLCSKGTYIRQLASDIGHDLQCGAYLRELRRLASGPFTLDQAVPLDELRLMVENRLWHERVMGMNDALAHLPRVCLEGKETVERLQQGYLDPALETDLQNQFSNRAVPVRLISGWNGDLIALWWAPYSRPQYGRLRVFGPIGSNRFSPSQDRKDSVLQSLLAAP